MVERGCMPTGGTGVSHGVGDVMHPEAIGLGTVNLFLAPVVPPAAAAAVTVPPRDEDAAAPGRRRALA